MMLATSHAESIVTPHHQAMRRLVQNRLEYGSVPRFRFYAYLCPQGFQRLVRYSGALLTGIGPVVVMCEIARFPLGYVVMGSDDRSLMAARHFGFADITHFLNSPHGTMRTVHLALPVLRPTTATPLVYHGATPLPEWLS
jgi:hypothetical protein